MSDRFSLVRTNINYNGGHRPAGSIAWTCGKANDGGEDGNGKPLGYPPHLGSIVARSRGTQQLLSFISLARGPVGDGVGPCLGYGGGAWGPRYDPFMVGCSTAGQVSIPELKLLEGLSPLRLDDRRSLLGHLDETRRSLDRADLEQWDGVHQRGVPIVAWRRNVERIRSVSRNVGNTGALRENVVWTKLSASGDGWLKPACRSCK